MLAWVVLAGGLLTSLVAGALWRSSVEDRQAAAFKASVRTAQSVVGTELRREQDLLANLQGMVTGNPDITNPQFFAWYETADIASEFPGGLGVNYIERVPAAELDAFLARMEADPMVGLADPTFTVFPDEPAAEHCLQRVAVWEVGVVEGFTIPAGLDFCAPSVAGFDSPLPDALSRATDSGRAAVLPTIVTGSSAMALIAPVYDTVAPPETVAGRRDASVGWTTASFDADLLVAEATAANPDARVAVEWRSPDGWVALATAGSAPDGARSTSVPVDDDDEWRVTVAAQPGAGELSPGVQGLAVALGGIVVSLLLFTLFRVLARSRERALALVDEKTEQLEYQALHDPLTGLPNRALLLDRIHQALNRRRRDDEDVAVLFVDLDNFKAVNDSLGHAAGDAYLRAVAERLTVALRGSDTVGRQGGDEFVVLVEGDALLGGPELVAQRILDVLSEPIVVDGVATPVSCSVGVALARDGSAEALLHDADVAMYRAKMAGKGGFVVFEPDMADVLNDRISLEWDLRDALERDELVLVYQPTFDLRSGTTTGVEALLRWNHPSRGVIAPLDFVPIAEETGLIVPIGRWVLHTACAQAQEWYRAGHPVRIAVNVSARQLDAHDLVDDVRSALHESGLAPDRLVLEITETTLMRDAVDTQARLEALKALGVHLAIDDFGTGYSSMAYLQRFPVDAIKIDRSFISGIADSTESHALIRTLIQLGKALHLETLAEGIEDRGQLDELVREDCDSGQGFLYARPLTAEAAGRFLAQHGAPTARSDRG